MCQPIGLRGWQVINGMAHWKYNGENILFTVADDRCCRGWNLADASCLHLIEPIDRLCGTLR